MTETILRLPAVKERTGLSRSSIYEKIRSKDFPEQIKLGERASGWIASEVDQWISNQIAESRNQTI